MEMQELPGLLFFLVMMCVLFGGFVWAHTGEGWVAALYILCMIGMAVLMFYSFPMMES